MWDICKAESKRLFGRMEPVDIESLPPGSRLDVDEYLLEHPESFAAKLRPRVGVDGGDWWVQYGDNMVIGVAGFGKSITSAFEDFERECATAIASRLDSNLNGESSYAKRRNFDV